MINVTLDTNCIIDLEEERPAAPCIRLLMDMHAHQTIKLAVVAISASERKPNGTYASSFDEFKAKIAAVGLARVEVLKPIAYWGITFWDWCLWGGEQTTHLERKIHRILFPEVEFTYEQFCRDRGLDPTSGERAPKWRNAKCDVLALWSHIWHGGGIFVTSDSDFHQKTKKPALLDLGAGDIDIMKPGDAVTALTKSRAPT